MMYAVFGAGGFVLGTLFGTKVISDVEKEFAKGFADVKTFFSTELANLKTKL